jgi:zinc/manganese transport system permease protein
LPAVAARFWVRDVSMMAVLAAAIGIISGYIGLALSAYAAVAAGPAIILVAGAIYACSVLFGRVDGVLHRAFQGRHLEA